MLYFILPKLLLSCLNVVFSGLITSVGEERADCSTIEYLFCGICSEGFPFPLGALNRLCHLIVALPGPSI